MKKRFLPLAAMAALSMSAFAQDVPSASSQVYDLNGYGDNILPLFYDALQQGRKYPTAEEFEAAGINLMDLAFVRSHVRPRGVMVDHTKDVNQKVREGRKLWMNIPMGIGKDNGGYPSSNFGDDTFTAWNYTNIFGSWNHPFFRAPGVWVDAAHKNGSDIYSGIKFFDTTGDRDGNDRDYVNLIGLKNPDGTFAYVEPIINALKYFGQDGINYNWEDASFSNADVIAFHQALYKEAERQGLDNFHIGIYTSISAITNKDYCRALLGADGVKTADCFLNYASSDFSSQIDVSATMAEKFFGTADGLYQGAWIVGMNRKWSNLDKNENAKKVGVVLWGEHAESRIHSYNQGNDAVEFQDNYQKLQERMFSGGYRNPAVRPTPTNDANWQNMDPEQDGLRTFQGLAEYIPERTAIAQNLPFTTFFNTGAGDRYNYKGKKTTGKWYNMGQQDVVPTYRWLVYDKGTTNAVKDALPEFTSADAYIGGSCIRLNGEKAQDIVLYRAALTCSAGNPTATVALKRFEGAPAGNLALIVKKQGSDQWVETPFAPVKGQSWEEQTVDLQGIAKGDVIEYVGLRTDGNVAGLLVGELSLNDDIKVTPAGVKDLVVDVKEETQVDLSIKLCWNVDAAAKDRADVDLLYNDEAGIDHFEILYKNGADGHVTEVGRTTTWSAFIGNKLMAADEKPFVGVRAASVDGKTYSDVVWVEVPRADASLLAPNSVANGSYPSIVINQNSENWETALKQRYFTAARTQGADVDLPLTKWSSSPADKSNYVLVDGVIKGHQGQTIQLQWNDARDGDGLNYCTARGYADWDRDYNFNGKEAPFYDYGDAPYDGVFSGAGSKLDSNPAERYAANKKAQDELNDEVIWRLGRSNVKNPNLEMTSPYTLEFTIPEDAVPGESRIRLVFSDAWFPHPGATGATAKGFAIDFPIEITGTNPGRKAAVDTHDAGAADEPAGLVSAILPVVGGGAVSKAALVGREIRFENVEKAWVYNTEGRLMKFALAGKSISVEGFAPGTYAVRMQNGPVMRTTKILVK